MRTSCPLLCAKHASSTRERARKTGLNLSTESSARDAARNKLYETIIPSRPIECSCTFCSPIAGLKFFSRIGNVRENGGSLSKGHISLGVIIIQQ
ncbi:hypothetical protein PUN28_018914 [Cardiocondyla obscurior]|uniref:Uncharacterized protein n=1 Tax=Cardiocondyla obscurior TaxID=286306 RepID=A0AAW2ECJ9_9HYME